MYTMLLLRRDVEESIGRNSITTKSAELDNLKDVLIGRIVY